MHRYVKNLESLVQIFLEGPKDGLITARYQEVDGSDWLLAHITQQTRLYHNGCRVAYRLYPPKDELRFSLNRCAALTRWFAAMRVPIEVKWMAEVVALCVTNPFCTRVFTGEKARQLLLHTVGLPWLMDTTKELPE